MECETYSQTLSFIRLCIPCLPAKLFMKQIWQESDLLYLCQIWEPEQRMEVLWSYHWMVVHNTKHGVWQSIFIMVFKKRFVIFKRIKDQMKENCQNSLEPRRIWRFWWSNKWWYWAWWGVKSLEDKCLPKLYWRQKTKCTKTKNS